MPQKPLRVIPLVALLASLQLTAEESSFTKGLPLSQRVFISGAIELSADKFFAAYMSPNVADRRYAETYLLGVLEATEGESWCSYRKFQTGTIDEVVFEGLKKLKETEKHQRAAKVIVTILNKNFPCEGSRK